MKPFPRIACTAICLLASCASTPEERIAKAPGQFKNYSAHHQYLIRQGRIEVGFDQEQVQLAWGNPQKSRQDSSAKGNHLIWEYTEFRPGIGAFSSATIKRGLNAGIRVQGNPTQTKVRGRVFFDPQTGKVSRFQQFD